MNYKIKPIFKYNLSENFAPFNQSRCLLTISVGQEVHEGEKLAATLDLVGKSFKNCILLIDDSLQRHTMALCKKEDADFFYEMLIQEGNLWLMRNEQYYSQLKNLEKIVRWDQWLYHPNYYIKQSALRNLLNDDLSYQSAFNHTINEFLRRYRLRLKEGTLFNMARARQLCFDYLLEECTAMCLWPQLMCHFEVYPSKRNQVMQQTHHHFVLPYYPDLLHTISIKFKNRKQLKPQQFTVIKDAPLNKSG